MTYYLYVKTHLTTGLKYLGQTKSKDPYGYKGSGVYWKRHLNVHGVNFKTDILLATNSKSELIETGVFFSKLWNIVESIEWANLTEESGSGGNTFKPETFEKIKATKLKRYGSEYYNNRDKISITLGITNVSQLESVRAKISESLKGVPKSESHKAALRKPKSNSENIAAARRKTYRYNNDIIINAKEYCLINNLSYQMFLRHAKNGTLYKNRTVEVL